MNSQGQSASTLTIDKRFSMSQFLAGLSGLSLSQACQAFLVPRRSRSLRFSTTYQRVLGALERTDRPPWSLTVQSARADSPMRRRRLSRVRRCVRGTRWCCEMPALRRPRMSHDQPRCRSPFRENRSARQVSPVEGRCRARRTTSTASSCVARQPSTSSRRATDRPRSGRCDGGARATARCIPTRSATIRRTRRRAHAGATG